MCELHEGAWEVCVSHTREHGRCVRVTRGSMGGVCESHEGAWEVCVSHMREHGRCV